MQTVRPRTDHNGQDGMPLDKLDHARQRYPRFRVPKAGQRSHADRAERDQACAFGLKCGHALFTHQAGADPHVKVHPVLDGLAFGNTLEEQSLGFRAVESDLDLPYRRHRPQ
ncbi:hypothetical protein Psuf_054760 [Phytohabitans suffuscus]|uniref:Uncharacterized protein n=1 Tax=Phytohabitans suffuscus TaxID=624315 RepID=A0A6F8YQ98_9ACTN|nr:hypothetical protein Psuf_054760 [Phytohabitans suffuscus]